MWALLVLTIAGTAASLLAPGNAIRSHSYPDIPTRHNLGFALGETASRMLRFVVQHGRSLELCTFAVVTWWWGSHARVRAMNTLRGFPIGGTWGFGLVLAIVMYLTLFPLYWEYGTNNYTGEGRTYNVTYAVFCIFMTWLVWTVLSGITDRWPDATARLRIHRRTVEWTLATSLAFLMISSPGTTKALRAAMVAPQYLQEQQRRESILRASFNRQKPVVVNALGVKPDGIFWGDIQPDATHWINSCVANYYGVGSVRTPSSPDGADEPSLELQSDRPSGG
jgi:hypothetical protein